MPRRKESVVSRGVSPEGEILWPLPCHRCGFSLEGLIEGDECPECAFEVQRTLDQSPVTRLSSFHLFLAAWLIPSVPLGLLVIDIIHVEFSHFSHWVIASGPAFVVGSVLFVAGSTLTLLFGAMFVLSSRAGQAILSVRASLLFALVAAGSVSLEYVGLLASLAPNPQGSMIIMAIEPVLLLAVPWPFVLGLCAPVAFRRRLCGFSGVFSCCTLVVFGVMLFGTETGLSSARTALSGPDRIVDAESPFAGRVVGETLSFRALEYVLAEGVPDEVWSRYADRVGAADQAMAMARRDGLLALVDKEGWGAIESEEDRAFMRAMDSMLLEAAGSLDGTSAEYAILLGDSEDSGVFYLLPLAMLLGFCAFVAGTVLVVLELRRLARVVRVREALVIPPPPSSRAGARTPS